MPPAIRLHSVEKGQGPTLLLVHGWGQSSRSFQHQIDDLSDRHRVIAVDLRGHGESPKPPHGYRIARLAHDLRDFILEKNLSSITVLGHSMGSSVIWSYLEQFGGDRLAKLVFVDESPVIINGFGLEGAALKDSEAIFSPEQAWGTAAGAAANYEAVLDGLKPAFFSPQVDDKTVAENKAESMKLPPPLAARLLAEHLSQDWRDVIEHIVPSLGLPTLFVGAGIGALFPPETATWMASKVPGARIEIFSPEERGSHFMFLENPKKFNALLREFMG